MYIHVDEVSDALHRYLAERCRRSFSFSLQVQEIVTLSSCYSHSLCYVNIIMHFLANQEKHQILTYICNILF